MCRSRRFRVYTRTGDKGTSSLYNGERRNKDDDVFEALGDVDELNASLGLAREFVAEGSVGIQDQLVWIQSRLLDVGSTIATPPDKAKPEVLARVAFPHAHAEQLEQWIDVMDDQLPPLSNFILPVSFAFDVRVSVHFSHCTHVLQSGGRASAQLHVGRTICRRAERATVHLVRIGLLSVPPTDDASPSGSPVAASPSASSKNSSTPLPVHPVSVFLNRLSDYLFVAARYASMKTGHQEEIYKKASGMVSRSFEGKEEKS